MSLSPIYLHKTDIKFDTVIRELPYRLPDIIQSFCDVWNTNGFRTAGFSSVDIMARDKHTFLSKLAACCQIIQYTKEGISSTDDCWSGILSKTLGYGQAELIIKNRFWNFVILISERLKVNNEKLSDVDLENIQKICDYDVARDLSCVSDVYYSHGVFMIMCMLYVPNFIEKTNNMYKFREIRDTGARQYNQYFNKLASHELKVIEHLNHWYRIFALNEYLSADTIRCIAFQYLNLILRDKENYSCCLYCSQSHMTVHCGFMNNLRCINCREFVHDANRNMLTSCFNCSIPRIHSEN